MPLLGNFAAQSNNRKKRDLPASPVLCLSRLFNVVYLSTCSSNAACSTIDNNLVIVVFDRCPRIERRRTSQQSTMRQATLACSSEVFARSNKKKKKKKKKTASPTRRETTFWCLLILCHWFLQTRTGVSESKWAYKGAVRLSRHCCSISWI